MRSFRRLSLFAATGLAALIAGCANTPPTIQPVDYVDLPRFMGRWYVIAHIPTWMERDAVNAVEFYEMQADGTIKTTYQYRNDSVDAPLKTMHPTGFVRPTPATRSGACRSSGRSRPST